MLDFGQTFQFTFNQAGEFQYFCVIHPFMMATITVTEAGSPASGAAAAAQTDEYGY